MPERYDPRVVVYLLYFREENDNADFWKGLHCKQSDWLDQKDKGVFFFDRVRVDCS